MGVDAYGIDISEFAVQHAYPEVREKLTVGDISEELPWSDSSFDLVTGFDVLEHQHDYERLLRSVSEMCRVARGSIFLRMPMVKYSVEGGVEACHELVAAANEAGGQDNITALIVSIADGSGQ